MKVSPELFARVKEWIKPYDTEATRQEYRDGKFPRADKVQDLDKRYRWDLFYGTEAWRCIWLGSEQLKDSHLDTMLRRIVSPLNSDTEITR